MKEFDFDELDRAVNSLMAKRDDETASTDQASASTTVPAISDDPVNSASTSVAAPAPREEAPAATREETMVPVVSGRAGGIAPRRGTVIDGIHSSTTRPSENLRPSRQGKTIQPDNAPSPSGPLIDGFVRPASTPSEGSTPPETDDTVSPMIESPLKQLTEQPVEESDETEVPSLDTTSAEPSESPAGFSDTEPELPTGEESVSLSNETSSASEVVSDDETTDEAKSNSAIDTLIASPPAETPSQPSFDTTGANSPFLPNTKVEKRPLGKATESPATNDDSDEGDIGAPAVAAPLPAELHDDLVDIESRVAEEPEKPATSEFTNRYTPAQGSAASSSAAPTAAAAVGPSSNDTQGAIYAADAHQQPLQHPAKKKSGIMLVVWIVVLLLIGAGGGAALYFSGIL